MQATNGSGVLFRSHTRLLGCTTAIALALAALAMVFASSASAAEPPHKRYLALGDSVAFGYSTELFNENFPAEEPAKFEVATSHYGSGVPNGYVLDYSNLLKLKNTKTATWDKAINNGCPGETTDGMIGNGPLRAELEARGLPVTVEKGSWIESTVTTAPCAYHNVNGFKLHHEYGGTKSQLESAIQVIHHENTGKNAKKHPVQLLTLNIGANDELRAVAKCEGEVKFEYEHTGDSKYNHPPYYGEEHEGHSPKNAVVGCIKGHLGEILHHIIGNVFAAGTAIRRGGELKLHGAVNYTGAFKFLGQYDPYGSVFEETSIACSHMPSPAECNRELLEGSTVLSAIFNNNMQELMTERLGGCLANPEPAFNPAIIEKPELEWGEGAFGSLVSTGHGGKPNGKGGIEPDPSPLGTLQKYTNMANFSSAPNGNKAKNGPGDIHPTPLGYEELANSIITQCP